MILNYMIDFNLCLWADSFSYTADLCLYGLIYCRPHKLFANKEKVECDQVNYEKDDYDEWNDGLSESEDDVDVSCHAVSQNFSNNSFIANGILYN